MNRSHRSEDRSLDRAFRSVLQFRTSKTLRLKIVGEGRGQRACSFNPTILSSVAVMPDVLPVMASARNSGINHAP